MNFSELRSLGVQLPDNTPEVNIKSICFDSRNVVKDSIFVALKGSKFDGHNYISEAISAGANSLLVDKKYNANFALPTSKSSNVRRHLALISAKFFKNQPNIISCVTGTNGKTSVCYFAQKIWENNGFSSGAIGTLGFTTTNNRKFQNNFSQNLTTLDPVTLHKYLAEFKNLGIERVSVEASSHGLSQHRIDGLKCSIACFTNLSHDHLDYHKTFKKYKTEKFRLFKELLMDGGTAIINLDDRYSKELLEIASKRNLKIITYGNNSMANWQIKGIFEQNGNKVFRLKINDKNYLIPTALNSDFQIYNAVAASAIANASGIPLDHSILSIRNLSAPIGRMQKVSNKYGYNIYIDYAHSPHALETILCEQKKPNSRLILVIGCGGERDINKRKMIGQISSKLCDIVIITDDNPRNESASNIRKQIIEGVKIKNLHKIFEVPNRKEAILESIKLAQTKDVILIAGKGHENQQIIGNKFHYFNDYEEAKNIVSTLGNP